MSDAHASDREAGQPAAVGTIGVLDSGVGGLSVVPHLRRELPAERLLYFADQAHIPYGSRGRADIQTYTAEIVRFLVARGAGLIVVACNTASAAALDFLRDTFTDLPIVGMEPAVKPAAALTRSGKVGVLATPGTFNSHRYASLMARFGNGIEVHEDPCAGLVQLIEAGALDAPETAQLLAGVVEPMVAAGVDTLVLGCTHYPFVLPLLRRIAGERIAIIDPAPAVARHARNVLQQNGLAATGGDGSLRCYTSGDAAALAAATERLLGVRCPTQQVRWRDNRLEAVGARDNE